MTASQYDMVDFYEAGAVPAVMHEILPLLHGDALTVTGKTMEENLKDARILRPEVIHPLEDPVRPDGGLAIIKGNPAPFPASANPQPSP